MKDDVIVSDVELEMVNFMFKRGIMKGLDLRVS